MSRLVALLSFLTLLIASPAVAQIDIEMAFDPDEVAPGDFVTLTGSIYSSYPEDLDAEFEFSASLNDCEIGPFTAVLEVCGGLVFEFSVPVYVPMGLRAGELTISITVTAEGASDTAVASLTISGKKGPVPPTALGAFVHDVVINYSCGGISNTVESFGTLKAVY